MNTIEGGMVCTNDDEFYIGNYPTLDEARIRWLCDILNSVRPESRHP